MLDFEMTAFDLYSYIIHKTRGNIEDYGWVLLLHSKIVKAEAIHYLWHFIYDYLLIPCILSIHSTTSMYMIYYDHDD